MKLIMAMGLCICGGLVIVSQEFPQYTKFSTKIFHFVLFIFRSVGESLHAHHVVRRGLSAGSSILTSDTPSSSDSVQSTPSSSFNIDMTLSSSQCSDDSI